MNCHLNKLRQKEECQHGNNGEDGKTEEWISGQGQSLLFCICFKSYTLESGQVDKGENYL